MRLNKLLILLSLLATLWPSVSMGLAGDTKQPIHIESDRAERNERKGITIYQGSVIIRQGTIRIEADTVSIYDTGERVEKIVCQGDLARYEQQVGDSQAPVIAYAKTIEYSIAADTISLIRMASLEQEGATITGEQIHYDLKNEVVKAKGDQTGKQRIQMIIPPQALEKREEVP